MKNNIIFLVILLTNLILYQITFVSSQTLSFRIVIYDHHPSLNPDFESTIGSAKGLASQTLNSNDVPDFTGVNGQAGIHNATTFSQWFVSTPGVNIAIPWDLVFVLDDATGLWTFASNSFFPIDNLGWDADPSFRRYTDGRGQYHNFHFCLHFASTLNFRGDEVFHFLGDDDVWVYLNKQLVLDLGGTHTALSGSVSLAGYDPSLGPLEFDFFYCERHTTQSNIQIQTNFNFTCAHYDYCGICEGDGTSCCNPLVDCNDGVLCTIDSCPVPAEGITQDNFREFCIHTDISCTSPDDMCRWSNCTLDGTCTAVDFLCIDRPCYTSQCIPESGCVFSPVVCPSSACQTSTCDLISGVCGEPVPVDCQDTNLCTDDFCVPSVGCIHTQKNCSDGDVCTTDFCDRGFCSNIVREDCHCSEICPVNLCQEFTCLENSTGCEVFDRDISDFNPCTLDSCDPDTGLITHTPIQCASTDACFIASCDPESGDCVETPKVCDDGDLCTEDSCQDGTCFHRFVNCTSPDPCQIGICVSSTGCVYQEKDCHIPNPCFTSTCNPTDGSCIRTPTNTSSDPCIIHFCDPRSGNITLIIKKCESSNPCSVGRCENGDCIYEEVDCGVPTDLCNPAECDSLLGVCVDRPVVCDEGFHCLNGECIEDPSLSPSPSSSSSSSSNEPEPPITTIPFRCSDLNTFCTYYTVSPLNGTCIPHEVKCPKPKLPCHVSLCDPKKGCVTVREKCLSQPLQECWEDEDYICDALEY